MRFKSGVGVCFVLAFGVSGCNGGGGSDSASSNSRIANDAVYGANIFEAQQYMVKKSDYILHYVYDQDLSCFGVNRFDILAENGNTISARNPDGEVSDIQIEAGGNAVSSTYQGVTFSFQRVAKTEGQITPLCGNPQAQGSVTVVLTLQDLPPIIPRGMDHVFEWRVVFDVDGSNDVSAGDVEFAVSSDRGPETTAETSTITDIGAVLWVYLEGTQTNNTFSTSVGDIDLAVDGNLITMSAPKSLFKGLETINTMTQFNAEANYRGTLGYHADFVPAENIFTSVQDTGDVSDDLNDMEGSAIFVDFTHVSVVVD